MKHHLLSRLTITVAISCAGLFAFSTVSSAATAAKPSAPRDVRAVAGDNSATVTWSVPASSGDSRITVYYVKELGTNAAIHRCAGTRCSIPGLPNGVGYRFSVAAVNKFGRGTYSAPSASVTPTAPVTTPPTTTTTGTTATITFNANGGIGIMAPEIETVDTSTALTINTFTQTGYTFSGWNTSANGSGTSFTDGEVVDFTTSATFYAQWAATTPTSGFTGTTSSNWSGYVLPTGGPATLVSGDFTVPTLNCAATPNGSTGTWVGIGGIDSALIQTGVNEECVGGVQENYGFWEIYPMTPNHSESFSNFPVSAGDSMIAGVGYENGQWVTLLEDTTTGLAGEFVAGDAWEVVNISTDDAVGGIQGYATNDSYSGGDTAEWIQEDVTSATTNSLEAFPNYGSVTFTNLKVTPNGVLPDNDAWEVTLNGVINGVPVSVPGPYDGTSFTVTYTG
jgi:hypothetical protein